MDIVIVAGVVSYCAKTIPVDIDSVVVVITRIIYQIAVSGFKVDINPSIIVIAGVINQIIVLR
ncbi:unnamed protein product [marine sediment metagenome]|uniref:Uncharacterized protein n=1 Tax=marine sediment metagenome TaxID=412755 RepID=X1DA29_9ZZZZ